MTDIATLGIKIESKEVVAAEKALDGLASSAKSTEAAVGKLSGSGDKAAAGLKKTAAEADKATVSIGRSKGAVQQLGFQLNDLGTQIAGGGSPLQALAQQGGQIFQVWQQSPTVFKDTARAIGGVLTPLRLLAGGVVGVGVAALVMAEQFKSSQREVERSISGAGRASGITVAGINAIADAEANRARISRSAAREIAAGYAASGNFNGASVEGLTGVTRDFGAQTGRDNAESVSRLSKALASPSQGLRELASEIGGVDAKTLNYIRSLEMAGEKQRAVQAAIEAVKGSVNGASDSVSIFTKAWQGATSAFGNFVDSIGKEISGVKTLNEKLADAIALRRSYAAGATKGKKLDTDIENLQEQLRLQGRLQRSKAETEQASRASLRADDLVRDFDPQIAQLEKLKQAVTDIDKASATGAGKSALGDGIRDATRAREAYQNAVSTTLTLEQQTTQQGSLQVQSILARTAAEQLSVDLERTRLQMAGQVIDAAVREQQVRNQINQAQANAAREARDALRSANDNLSMAGLLPYQAATRQIQIDARNLRERTTLPASSTNVVPFISGGQRDSNIPTTGGYSQVGPFRMPSAGASAMSSAGMAGLAPSFAEKVKRLIAAVDDSGATMTSGFRSREKQQELYDRYGPGKAAAPGNSQHERGTAADYTFSSPEARARAMAMASQHGLRALGSNGGAVHFDNGRGGATQAATQITNADTEARTRNARSAQEQARDINLIDAPLRASRMELDQQRAALDLQEKSVGMSARAIATAAKEQELLNQFQRQGVPITDELRAKVRDLAGGYGELAANTQTSGLRRDLRFEGEQAGRTGVDQQIASRLRGVYGEGYRTEMDGAIANQMRFNSALEQTGQMAGDAFKQVTDGILNGAKAGDIFKSVLKSIASQALNTVGQSVSRGITGILGSLIGGFGGGASSLTGGLAFANGGAFANNNIHRFANGGAFTNQIVSRPTLFQFARGGALGEMGEAGPEAIMPLKRGSDGSLGVQMNGGGAGVTNIVQGATNITVTGEVNSQVEARLMKHLAERDRNFARNVAAANRDRQLRNRAA